MLKNEMDSLLAKGGLKDEAGEVEEETGNVVPAGSLKEEVADQVDAKLSPGEFVIPADVVRYIGLEKLMKMRDQAKEGLERMAEIGQVGNADEVEDADELHKKEAESEDGDNNYASGGYVGGTANAEKYKRSPLKGFEMVQMTDDKGNTVFIPFVNGKPQLQVPVGYKPVVNQATTPTAAAHTTTPAAPATPAYTEPVRGGGGAKNAPSTPSSGGSTNTPLGLGGFSMSADGSSTTPNTVNPTAAAAAAGVAGMFMGISPAITAPVAKTAVEALNKESITQSNLANAALSRTQDGESGAPTSDAPTATTGAEGTGKTAAQASADAAAKAVAEGLSAAQVGAVAQAAADAAIAKTNIDAAVDKAIADAKAGDSSAMSRTDGAKGANGYGGGGNYGYGGSGSTGDRD